MNHQLNRERQQTVCFRKKERRVVAQSIQATDVTGLGCCIYLVLIKAEDEIRGV